MKIVWSNPQPPGKHPPMSVKTLYQVGNASDKVAQYKYLNTIKITITSDDDDNNYYSFYYNNDDYSNHNHNNNYTDDYCDDDIDLLLSMCSMPMEIGVLFLPRAKQTNIRLLFIYPSICVGYLYSTTSVKLLIGAISPCPSKNIYLWDRSRSHPDFPGGSAVQKGNCVEKALCCLVAVWERRVTHACSHLWRPSELIALTMGHAQRSDTYQGSALMTKSMCALFPSFITNILPDVLASL